MIVWLSSYPRSGSTYFKFLFHHLYDVPTYLEDIADISDLANPLCGSPCSIPVEALAKSERIYFVKTYRLPIDDSPAIYLVRDGRDTLISYSKFIASYHADKTQRDLREILKQLITSDDYFGGWNNHVLTWKNRKAPTVIIKFEDLVTSNNPAELLQKKLNTLDSQILTLTPTYIANLGQIKPTKTDFKGIRKEKISNWVEELPPELHELFWQKHQEAMLAMDYSYDSQLLVTTQVTDSNQLPTQENELDLDFKELNEKDAILARQLQELIEKEQVIKDLIVYKNFSLTYWYFCRIRPFFIKKINLIIHYILQNSTSATQRSNQQVAQIKTTLSTRTSQLLRESKQRLFQPYHDSQVNLKLWQYPAIPLKIPDYYYQAKLTPDPSLPLVSIVTPSYNQCSFVERTLKSILDQNYPHTEYIVQDGASTDGTVTILENYRSQISQIESIPDSGQANAINRGFAKSTGKIMAWLNSDDLLLPGTLDYVVHYFLNHPEVDAVYGHRILIDENDNEVGRWILPPHDRRSLFWADYIPQETLFWRRSLWDKVGGCVDESYRFAMDWELLIRFQESGAKIVRLPRFLGAFRLHSQQKTSASLDTLGEKEMKRLRERCHGRPISQTEVELKIRPYWWRSGVLRLLYQFGLLRY